MNSAKPCLIFNPSARGDKARRLRSHLDILHGQCVLLATAGPGDARRLAAQSVRNGFQTVIAAGGDGTANEVLNGIADVPGGLAVARLGILPLGTINVFARELRIPINPVRAWKILEAGRERKIDLGRAEFGPPEKRESRCFLQLAGAGLDSRAIELTDWEVKKKIGPLAYVVAGWKALRETHPVVTAQGDTPVSSELVLIGNGRYYGGTLAFFPKAKLDDGLLDVCAIPRVSLLRCVRALGGLATGRLPQSCGAVSWAAAQVTLTSPSRVILQLDGDNVGELPATLSIERQAIRVIVP